VQLEAIMRTVSTFSFGAFAELAVAPDPAVEPAAVDPVVAPVDPEDGEDELSSVPVISTL
jgi:hypothetical protein